MKRRRTYVKSPALFLCEPTLHYASINSNFIYWYTLRYHTCKRFLSILTSEKKPGKTGAGADLIYLHSVQESQVTYIVIMLEDYLESLSWLNLTDSSF